MVSEITTGSCRAKLSSSMDVGITVAFDFTGTPPFTIEYTEKKGHSRATTRTETFRGFTGEVTFRPEQDGQYTYVSHPAGGDC